MYSPAKGLPESFDPGKFKPNSEEIDLATTKNVKWVAKLGSQTYGNPVVANGKVFVGTNNAIAARSEVQGRPVDASTPSTNTTANSSGSSPCRSSPAARSTTGNISASSASPHVEGGKVYLVTNRCEVVCLDAEGMANGNDGPFKDEAKYLGGPGKPPVEPGKKDADIIWRYDMMDELGVFPHNASNCSVITLGDTLFTCTSNGQDWTHVNIPSPLSPSFIALDKKTGELLGEDDAKIGTNIKHGQWTSPSIGQGQWQGPGLFRRRRRRPLRLRHRRR